MIMKRRDSAVSPVIGILLMLVVTIIIAAIVSGFAGSFAKEDSKTPQMTFKGEMSRSGGLKVTHTGGDTLATMSTNLVIRPTKTFGSYDQYSWIINKTVISDASNTNKKWESGTSALKIRFWEPGQSMIVLPADYSYAQRRPDGTDDSTSSSYGINNQASEGKTISLELQDSSGKIFAKTEMPIKP